MIEILVASKNRTKRIAVALAANQLWSEQAHIVGVKAKSGVSDQPMSDEEMIEGATNRVRAVSNELRMGTPTRYVVGLEGGIRVTPHGWFDLGWVCVEDVRSRKTGLGATPALAVPKAVQKVMEEQGLELSNAVAEVYGTDTVESRDCSGVITNGLLPAEKLYQVGVLSAFAALRNEINLD